jgi:thiamine biosynthesis lipoprotein
MVIDCTHCPTTSREAPGATLFSVLRHTTVAAALSSVCAVCLTAGQIREEGHIDAMGSIFSVIAYGETAEHARTAIDRALGEAARLDAMLSNYKPHSEWSEMNRAAADGPVRLSAELFHLIQFCLNVSRQSEGAFDISVGPLMRVWGFYKEAGHLANQAELSNAMQFVGYRNVILDARSQTVRFSKKGVELDPGGIGKGYAVDCMIAVLRRNNIQTGFVSAGGSSIYALGAPPGEDGWTVKMHDPRSPSIPAATVRLRDQSLSTSGSYEKFFIADGKRWSHIMDPRTGSPAPGMLSVSVISPKTIDSEAWAKPYFILGRAWTERHKPHEFRVFMCEDAVASPCAWIE